MKTTEQKFYLRPETNVVELKSQAIYLTSFNPYSLNEDNSDSENSYTEF